MTTTKNLFERLGLIRKNGAHHAEKAFESVPASRALVTDWGYEEAGLHRGNPEALVNFLRLIRERHLNDEAGESEAQEKRRAPLRRQIEAKELRVAEVERLLSDLEERELPGAREALQQRRLELAELQTDIREKRLRSEYEPARFWLYCILFAGLSLFLLLFYASAINAAFFRDMREVVTKASESNVGVMLNSIFDMNGIFRSGAHLVIVYLGAFLFLAYGTLPHIILHGKSRYRLLGTVLAVLITLAVDALIAYKIDSGIHDMRKMMGLDSGTWHWYSSVNFYLVLSFGFGGYMIWGILYEASIRESKKRNPDARGEAMVKAFKEKIADQQEMIRDLEKQGQDLRRERDVHQLAIHQLTKELERILANPEELLRYLESFYSGWLRYVNQCADKDELRPACEEQFLNYRGVIEKQYYKP